MARRISRQSQGIARKLHLGITRVFLRHYALDLSTHGKGQNHKIPPIGRTVYDAINIVHKLDKAAQQYDHRQRCSDHFPNLLKNTYGQFEMCC